MKCFIYQSVNFEINSVHDFESMQRMKTGVIWQNLDVLQTTRANDFCTRCDRSDRKSMRPGTVPYSRQL